MSQTKIIRGQDYGAPIGIGNPLTIPGAFLWLDASDIGAGQDPNPANNTEFSTWRDKSGNANDFEAIGTGATRPTFLETGLAGEPTVQIDGTQLGLRANALFAQASGPMTICFVGQMTSNSFYLIDVNSSQRFLYWLNNASSGNWYYQNAFEGTPGVAENGILYSVLINDQARTPTTELRTNGTILRTDADWDDQDLDNTLSLGSRYTGEATSNWAGLMSEWVMFDRALDSAEIGLMEAYFSNKWNII